MLLSISHSNYAITNIQRFPVSLCLQAVMRVRWSLPPLQLVMFTILHYWPLMYTNIRPMLLSLLCCSLWVYSKTNALILIQHYNTHVKKADEPHNQHTNPFVSPRFQTSNGLCAENHTLNRASGNNSDAMTHMYAKWEVPQFSSC